MVSKRKKYPAELKAKVALEALRGDIPIAKLASRYNVHPNLVTNWKKRAREQVLQGFSGRLKRARSRLGRRRSRSFAPR